MTTNPPAGWTETVDHQHLQPANAFREARWVATGEPNTHRTHTPTTGLDRTLAKGRTMTAPDWPATFALAGNETLDHLLAAQAEDCRIPLLLVTNPDTIPEAIIRAALVAAIQRLEEP